MGVVLISLPGCSKCMAAKQKLELLKVEYVEETGRRGNWFDEFVQREMDGKYPVIVIDDKPYDYPNAMRALKVLKGGHNGGTV